MTVWDDISGDAIGDRLAIELRDMVKNADWTSTRSTQIHLGPSEIGDPCTHCLAAKILGLYERPELAYDDGWRAIVGTSIHKWLEKAALKDNRDNGAAWCTEERVFPDEELLPVGGKCDLYQDSTGTVIDHKTTTKKKINDYKANGVGIRNRRQAHLYGLGFANAGMTVKHVALAFWVRDGMARDLWVWAEPYDEAMAKSTLDRYRTLRDLCATTGEAILASLPSDPACHSCSRSNQATA